MVNSMPRAYNKYNNNLVEQEQKLYVVDLSA
jgi:hypothetical protein